MKRAPATEPSSRSKRLLVLNQYYWPGVEATARLLTQLCEELAAEFEVTVITGRLRESAVHSERIVRNGVEIVRVPSTVFDRAPLALRAVNYLTYMVGSLWSGLRVQRPDVVLCMTDPPVLANVALALARRFRAPLVVVTQDVFPEIAVQLGRLEQPVLVGLLRRAISHSLGRADTVVAIGDTMRTRLEAKGVRAGRITVIPNWADTGEIAPRPRDNAWASAHGLVDRFVVMHSGNVGYAQDLDTLIRASTLVRDLDRLLVAIIGTGARLRTLTDLSVRLEADAVRFLPYQPPEILSSSLSAADLHFVGLARGLAGYVVPSRLYGIMAAGRPVLVSAEGESETAQLVNRVGCGVVVPPARVDLVARELRRLAEAPDELEAMGRRGLDYVRTEATRDIAVGRYQRVLGSLIARP